jgi:hypothetical protein
LPESTAQKGTLSSDGIGSHKALRERGRIAQKGALIKRVGGGERGAVRPQSASFDETSATPTGDLHIDTCRDHITPAQASRTCFNFGAQGSEGLF